MKTWNFHRKYCLRSSRNLQWVIPLEKKNKLSSIFLVENSFSSISPTIWSRVRLSQWWHFINFTVISLMFTHKYLPQKCHSFKLLDTSLSHRVLLGLYYKYSTFIFSGMWFWDRTVRLIEISENFWKLYA